MKPFQVATFPRSLHKSNQTQVEGQKPVLHGVPKAEPEKNPGASSSISFSSFCACWDCLMVFAPRSTAGNRGRLQLASFFQCRVLRNLSSREAQHPHTAPLTSMRDKSVRLLYLHNTGGIWAPGQTNPEASALPQPQTVKLDSACYWTKSTWR